MENVAMACYGVALFITPFISLAAIVSFDWYVGVLAVLVWIWLSTATRTYHAVCHKNEPPPIEPPASH